MVEVLDYAKSDDDKPRRRPFFSKFSVYLLVVALCVAAFVSLSRSIQHRRLQNYADEIRAKLAPHPSLQGVRIRFSPYPALFFTGEIPDQEAAALLIELMSTRDTPRNTHLAVRITDTDLIVGNEAEEWAPKVVTRIRSHSSRPTSQPSLDGR